MYVSICRRLSLPVPTVFLASAMMWSFTLVSAQTAAPQPRFIGSAGCAACHAEIYKSWKQTRMANVVRDPREHPDAVLADFASSDPSRSFDLGQVAFVYGSRWKQRYFTKRGDDYFALPAQWDVKHKKWLVFHVDRGKDWWTEYYPEGNMERPTGPLCDGCHSVNYDLATKTPTEWNVGCEKCHGPGSEHAAHPAASNIVNPRALDFVRANDTCIQCHSQGRPLNNPIAGRYFDWPVGYLPGQRLSDFWRIEESKLGQTDFYYYADGTAHKNRMQGNDFAQAVMYHRNVRCFDCHNVHSNQHESNLVASTNDVCLRCHGPGKQPGPRMSIVEHTHHAANSPGSQCTACHMPLIEQTLGDQNVASHTFRFISPLLTQQFGIPNPCGSCHKDKNPEWALQQLASWQTVSPWRMVLR